MNPVQLRVISVLKTWAEQTEDFLEDESLRRGVEEFFSSLFFSPFLRETNEEERNKKKRKQRKTRSVDTHPNHDREINKGFKIGANVDKSN